MKSANPFTNLEKQYIHRVAGRVPVAFISDHLGRGIKSVRDFCFREKISTRVPVGLLKKHWPEYLPKKREPS